MLRKVLVQSADSARYFVNHAFFFEYSLAQLRSDVFFSLAFGGQIALTAEKFMDSAGALRVFGELFSNVSPAFCTEVGWFPLTLIGEGDDYSPSFKKFIAKRWINPENKAFALLREDDDRDAESHWNVRASCVGYLESEDWSKLSEMLQRVQQPIKISTFSSKSDGFVSFPIVDDSFVLGLSLIADYFDRARASRRPCFVRPPGALQTFDVGRALVERIRSFADA